MKRILLTISIILIQKVLFAQNWAPLISVDKYNFRVDNSNFVNTTIWVDAKQISGLDSIFNLNRTMCENCLTWVGGGGGGPPVCDSCYGLKNQPLFLQRKCIAYPNGVFQFLDTLNLVINSHASVGNSWTFDSSLNIIANVISVGFNSVLGNPDSVKTILLSSGDTIRLSKNYGLLQFPNGYSQNSYYRLTGIEGRNVGEFIPKFSDFYNINIGDLFEYHDTVFDHMLAYAIRKYTITSKQIIGDSIVFGMNGFQKGWGSFGTGYSVINNQLIVVNSVNHITNAYNNQMLSLSVPGASHLLYGNVKFSVDSSNLPGKSIGSPYRGKLLYYSYSGISDTMKLNHPTFASGYRKYVIGLGETDYVNNFSWEGCHITHLTAYRKGLDTIGVFTPDSVLIGINEIHSENFISIYPNPAQTLININFNNSLKGNASIAISDMENRIVLSDDFSNSMPKTLDVSSFANGIYMLKIVTGDDTFIKKLVVQR